MRDISIFKNCFTSSEWDHINKSRKDNVEVFYKLWVKKEAVTKADGGGLRIPLNSFSCLNHSIRVGQNEWCFSEIDHFKGYWGQVACNKKGDIHFIDFTGKLNPQANESIKCV